MAFSLSHTQIIFGLEEFLTDIFFGTNFTLKYEKCHSLELLTISWRVQMVDLGNLNDCTMLEVAWWKSVRKQQNSYSNAIQVSYTASPSFSFDEWLCKLCHFKMISIGSKWKGLLGSCLNQKVLVQNSPFCPFHKFHRLGSNLRKIHICNIFFCFSISSLLRKAILKL